MIAAIIANVNRKQGSDPFEPGDFFPSLKRKDKGMTGKAMLDFMRARFPKGKNGKNRKK